MSDKRKDSHPSFRKYEQPFQRDDHAIRWVIGGIGNRAGVSAHYRRKGIDQFFKNLKDFK